MDTEPITETEYFSYLKEELFTRICMRNICFQSVKLKYYIGCIQVILREQLIEKDLLPNNRYIETEIDLVNATINYIHYLEDLL